MSLRLLIGTYAGGNSKGIYHAIWQDEALRITGCTEAVHPSYLAADADRLYAVREVDNGSVGAYRVQPDGTLTPAGEQPVGGDAPCHVCVAKGRLYVSNYGSGTMAVFELDGDGAIPSAPRVIAHEGRGADPIRQCEPHVHQAQPTPDGRFIAVCDLRADAVYFYPLSNGGLHAQAQRVSAPAGTGPRHLAFGRDGIWYVLCELSCIVLAYRGYGDDARLIQEYGTLRARETESVGAAIRLSPDGRYVLKGVRTLTERVIGHGRRRVGFVPVDGNDAVSGGERRHTIGRGKETRGRLLAGVYAPA